MPKIYHLKFLCFFEQPAWRLLLIALALSIFYFFSIYNFQFILGTGPQWEWIIDDPAQRLIGWLYYAQDQWRFPLFKVNTLGYPDGTNIIFTDSIPICALIFKIIYKITSWKFNYFGFWFFLCYILQALSSSLLLYILGVRSFLSNACGVIIALCASILLQLGYQPPLSSHFLIIFSLCFYFILIKQPFNFLTWSYMVINLIAALLIHAYIFIMVFAIFAATMAELARHKKLTLPVTTLLSSGVLLFCFVILIVAGYIDFDSERSSVGGGFGYYSMNILSPFFSYSKGESYTQLLLGPVTVDATGGQYEGANYLGFGILILSIAILIFFTKQILAIIRSNLFLTIVLIILLVLALSNKIFIGKIEFFQYSFPHFLANFAQSFRSSGRFFWPIFYIISLGTLAFAWRFLPRTLGMMIFILVAIVQFAETAPMRAGEAVRIATVQKPQFTDETLINLINRSPSLYFFPSYSCPRVSTPWRKYTLEILQVAAQRAIPSNSIYESRNSKDCSLERKEFPPKFLEKDRLYIIRPDFESGVTLINNGFEDACSVNNYSIICADFLRNAISQEIGTDAKPLKSILPEGELPYYRLGELIELGSDSERIISLGILKQGWSVPEFWGRWTDGNEVTLQFKLTQPPQEDLILLLNGGPYTNEQHPNLTIDVFANTTHVTQWTFHYGSTTPELRVLIPKEVAGAASLLNIKLHIQDPESPKNLGLGEDRRLLGIGVNSLCLTTVVSDQSACRPSAEHKIYALSKSISLAKQPDISVIPGIVGRGWSAPDDWGRWTKENIAILQFHLAQAPQTDLELLIDGLPSINERHPILHVDVFANDSPVAEWTFHHGHAHPELRVKIPVEVVRASSLLTVMLEIYSLEQLKGSDRDQDGYLPSFGIKSLCLTKANSKCVLPFYQIGELINLADKSDISPAFVLGQGWSFPEPWGRWTEGNEISLYFLLGQPSQKDLEILLNGGPYTNAKHPTLNVDVIANDTAVAHWNLQYGYPSPDLRAKIPEAVAKASPLLMIKLHIHNPESPKNLGFGDDQRLLGLGIRSLCLREASSSHTACIPSSKP
ncbi:MAG: DUF6311 domain-containing protein [Candidatus Competibacteraceae bacterium]